ncbi:cytochrome P450 2J4-like [Amphiura filiformis]|uniref:cytochrome P450 2J4-like n=1 Tax=Amphiura filiformis TaxID=82378 RepID=UPI003B22277D
MTLSEIFLSYINAQTVMVCIVIYFLLSFSFKRRMNLPPGPWSLPLLGNIPILAIGLYRTGVELPEHLLAEMAKKYGKVFKLKIGSKLIVVINGCEYIKEAFKNHHINDRPESQLFQEVGLDDAMPITSGKSWKYQHTFTLHTFQTFGVGRSKFEGNIINEANTLVEGIRDSKGNRFDPHILIGNAVSNITCSVVFGKRYDHADPEFQRIIMLLYTMVNKMGSGGVVTFLPIAKYIFPEKYRDVSSAYSEFRTFIHNHVDEHQRKFDTDKMHDFIDVFLNEIELAKKETGDRTNYLHYKSLTATATFLFLAGTEPSTTTLRWALLYMMMHTEIQAKVQQEIDTIVGRMHMPQWSDRLLLPYTEAVLLEVQRIRTILALGTPHVASQDTKLAGYDIPKGTYVVSNVWALHNDPDVWNEPDQFKPERFLDEDGKLCHREELIPFGTGNRVCAGENLAKMELFLFFTYIMHSFTITKPHDAKAPSMKGIGGFTFCPTLYELIATDRK